MFKHPGQTGNPTDVNAKPKAKAKAKAKPKPKPKKKKAQANVAQEQTDNMICVICEGDETSYECSRCGRWICENEECWHDDVCIWCGQWQNDYEPDAEQAVVATRVMTPFVIPPRPKSKASSSSDTGGNSRGRRRKTEKKKEVCIPPKHVYTKCIQCNTMDNKPKAECRTCETFVTFRHRTKISVVWMKMANVLNVAQKMPSTAGRKLQKLCKSQRRNPQSAPIVVLRMYFSKYNAENVETSSMQSKTSLSVTKTECALDAMELLNKTT